MRVVHAPDFENLKGVSKHSDEEIAQLEKNVLDDPQHERFPPIPIWQCGKDWIIVDGNNQHRLRERHSLKIKYVKLDLESRDEAIAYAYDCQLGRRSLGTSQRALALAARPKVRAKPGPKPNGELSENFPITQAEAAEAAGVSDKTLRFAEKVAENAAAAVVHAVEQGEVSVSDAASVADLPKSEQTAALKAVKSGKAKTLRAAVKPKPKPGKPIFDYKKWEATFGTLVRMTTEHHKAYPNANMRDACKESLNTYLADFTAWRKIKRS